MTRQTVLITGASGFVGRAVVAAMLKDGELDVHTASRTGLPPGLSVGHEHHHRCDLFVEQQAQALVQRVRPDILVHNAWYAKHGKFWNAPENREWVSATAALARVFQLAGGKRFVGVGSCAEYEWGSQGDLDERESALKPSTLYGASKNEARVALQALAEETGMDWAWARLFMMYGPEEEQTRLLPSIALPLLRGENARCSAGSQVRDFLHVSDVGSGISRVALSSVSGPVNVASGVGVRVGDFAAEIERAVAGRAELERGALAIRPGDPERIVANTGLLQSLGFQPKFDLSTGVAQAVESLRG
ncbi:MAG: nucleoside-diphosphate-sugar epimerase [Candidatus Paceibacteria bacterium]|jgi:nucleoside-diphosphate-sugar epimerase